MELLDGLLRAFIIEGLCLRVGTAECERCFLWALILWINVQAVQNKNITKQNKNETMISNGNRNKTFT